MTRSRLILRTGSALAALSTALVAISPAQAQGLLAGGFVTGGDANAQISTSPNQTNVLVNANQVIIDWTPTENTGTTPINLLPNGNALYFDANQGVTDFTVLNRIQPINAPTESLISRVIELNGTVQSRIGNGFGGNVWFYTPGGFVVGSTGRFDVGGLVLTTNPIDVTGGLFGTNGEIRFRGPAGNAFGVTVNAGAQINALAAGSYVALVAPSVVMNGRVNVDGSVAYVGAEQADVRINGGLFDIAVTVGTGQAHGVEHGGTTTGPASTSAADTQRAVMVAVPKNQAMTMLLSGSIGYAAATNATLEGSAVVLSAGHDVREGAAWSRSPAGEVGGIAIGTATFSSAVTGQATGTIGITPTPATTTLFQSTASFGAPGGISVTATAGGTVRALRDLSLTSTTGAVGGSITLTADAGVIDVTPGILTLNARGDSSFDTNALGGTIALGTAGGRIAAGQIDADAGAFAGDSLDATGGTVTLATSLNGVIETPITNLRASGDGRFTAGEPVPNGGDGIGGTIRLISTGGRLLLGDVNAVAQATAGTASSGNGGSATGGDILVDLSAGNHQWNSLFADVSTAAGYTTQDGASGGAQGGGTGIAVTVTGAETLLDITRSVSLYADGKAFGGGASAAAVRGGGIAVSARDGGAIQVAQDLYAQSRGDGGNFNIVDGTRVVPDVFGGTIDLTADGGAITAGALLLHADAAAGFADVSSGLARGGNVTVNVVSNGSLNITDCPTYSCAISTSARGGSALTGSDAIGGTIAILNDANSLLASTGQFYVESNGQGGRAANGGNGQGANGTGGTITLTNRGTARFGQLFVEASGSASEVVEGFFVGSGSGGIGRGGSVAITQAGGSLTAALLRASANGEGGYAGANCIECTSDDLPFTAGAGIGGTSGLTLNGGTANIGLLSLYADGIGGATSSGGQSGDIAGLAGNGTGGSVGIGTTGGSLTSDFIILSADGQGGLTQDAVGRATGSGGTGTGGSADMRIGGGSVTAPNLIVRAEGIGGSAGAIERESESSAVITATGQGGNATGGNARMTLATGALTASSISLSARGVGGNGSANETAGAAGSAGNGTGGTAALAISGAGHVLGGVTVSAAGEGGIARRSSVGSGGFGGNGNGGTARATLGANGRITTLAVSAEGTGTVGGAGGVAGGGGSGRGGTANVAATAGDFTISGGLTVNANGEGAAAGSGQAPSAAVGGSGSGGRAAVSVINNAARLRVDDVSVTANGRGGTPGALNEAGGNGTGGTADVSATDGARLDYAGDLDLSTTGLAGTGGEGRGGTSVFQVNGATAIAGANGTLRIDSDAQFAGSSQLLLTNATTALGDVSLSAIADTAGPVGRGGQILVRNQGEGISAPGATSITANASATNGGNAGYIALEDEALNGSLAVSGPLSFTNTGAVGGIGIVGIFARLTGNAVTIGELNLSSSGGMSMIFEGAGGLRATGSADLQTGGSISLMGQFAPAGTASIAAGTGLRMIAGNGITGEPGAAISSGGDIALETAFANIRLDRITAAGDASLIVRQDRFAPGDGRINTPVGTIAVSDNLAVGGRATLMAPTSIDVRALGDLNVASAVTGPTGGITIVSTGSLIVGNGSGGTIGLTANTGLTAGNLTTASGGIRASADGAVSLTNMSAQGDLIAQSRTGSMALSSVRATAIDVGASGSMAVSDSRATAGGIQVKSDGNATLTGVSATGALTAQARGALTASDISGTSLTLDAGGPLTAGTARTTAGDIRATSGGNASLTRLVTTGDVVARSAGTLSITGARAAAVNAEAGGSLAIVDGVTAAGNVRAVSSGGAVRIADTTAANNLDVRAAGDVTIDGQVHARAVADIGTPGTLSVNGQVTGGAVTLASSDMAIATGGGVLATPDAPDSSGLLTLNATGSGTTFLGGPANAAGYSLTGAEMAALRGRSITINANGAVELGSFAMTSGTNGNLADDGLFSILSPTTMRVNGAIRIDAMPRSAQLLLGATQRIVVDPATGLIDLRGRDAEGLGGTLRLRSNAVYVATDAAIGTIAGLTDPTLIDARLAQNDGIVRPDNIVRAIDIVLEVAEGAYIQNLGAGTGHDQRRGFLATGSTLYIDTASVDTRVVINGQLLDDVTPTARLSGLAVAPIIMVNGVRGPMAGGRFDQRSTVNGCLMIDPASCRPRGTDVTQIALSQSGRDAIDRVLDPNPLLRFTPFLLAAIELRDYVPQAYLPLIDEPVTGAGNDDLWQCDESKPGCARPNP